MSSPLRQIAPSLAFFRSRLLSFAFGPTIFPQSGQARYSRFVSRPSVEAARPLYPPFPPRTWKIAVYFAAVIGVLSRQIVSGIRFNARRNDGRISHVLISLETPERESAPKHGAKRTLALCFNDSRYTRYICARAFFVVQKLKSIPLGFRPRDARSRETESCAEHILFS